MDPLDNTPDEVLLYGAGASLALEVARVAFPDRSGAVLIDAVMPLVRNEFAGRPRAAVDDVEAAVQAVRASARHRAAYVARGELRRLFGDDLPPGLRD